MYDLLTPKDRFQLVLEAAARRDGTEVERLASTCQRYRYTSTRSDPAFAERLRASRQIALCVCLMQMQMLANLMVIRTSQESVALLSRSLATEFDRGYVQGWEAGCEHAWLSAGMAGPLPHRGNGDLGLRANEIAETLAGEDQNTDGGGDELEAVAEALATEVRSLWEAFSRLCRAEMGSESETVLLAWFPPMQGWIEGALRALDGVQVDADLLLKFEIVLTDAWRGFLRHA